LKLTPRQSQILALIASGMTTQEIAWQLKSSPKTVSHQRQQIMDATGRHNIAKLVHLAIKLNLVLVA
jgi:DNA-binding NarL/FixJ family response regulator